MIPSTGRIVNYTLTESQADEINRRRAGGTPPYSIAREENTGAVFHVGNPVKAGDIYPMIITRLWTDNPSQDSPVQGQVFLDGNDNLWVSSVIQGEDHGQWFQPVRV